MPVSNGWRVPRPYKSAVLKRFLIFCIWEPYVDGSIDSDSTVINLFVSFVFVCVCLNSSGKLFLMNMESTQRENMLATAPSNWKESTSTTMRLPVSWRRRLVINVHKIMLVFACRRWKVRPSRRLGGSGTWHHGFSPLRTLRKDFQTRQLRVRPEWRRQQLGQGSLHWRCWAGRLSTRCCPQRSRKLWLPSGKKSSCIFKLYNDSFSRHSIFRDSNWPTLWEVVPDLVWVPYLSPKSEKSTLTESWTHSQLFPHPK